jgi:Protein of unknown function (DUF4013)
MNYSASVTDFFKSPKWMMNMLLAGLCLLIPLVGPIVVMGWLITGFWGRDDKKPETFPAFNFEEFGKYLERGLWPFLVVLVSSFLLVPIMFILMIPIMFLGGLLAGHQGTGSDFSGAIFGILMALFYLLMMMLMALLLAPLKLRASLTQDFVKSFDFPFIMRFIALTWKEIIVAWLFLMVASIGLTIVGVLVFCVGIYFAMVVIYFAWTHLYSQLYLLYLSRGGEPVPRSPKLSDGPPPLTAT